jgi:glycosyltransferase involved in cell wall biosynthesis
MASEISVVIPVFNGAAYLAECVASIRAQTLRPDAIIVVDDGSQDETPAITKQLGDDIVFYRQAHRGVSCARNAGQKLAQTQFIAFADCDDLWLPKKLEWQKQAIERQTHPAMIFGQVEQFLSPELDASDREALEFDGKIGPGWMASNLFMCNRDFDRIGPFDPAIQIGEFIEWFARAKDIGLVPVMLPELTCRRRIHKNNTGRRERDKRHDYLHALKKTLDRRRLNP